MATNVDPTVAESRQPQFDDRLDTRTRISNREVLAIIWRSLKYIGLARRMYALKVFLALLTIVPVLYGQWLSKILVDQVLLQQPFDTTDIRMPPHVQPFVDFVYNFGPFEILIALTAFAVIMLLLFGSGIGLGQGFAQGEDSATQSENAMNEGDSDGSSALGFLDSVVQIRLSQRLTNYVRTTLFRRMGSLPMTTLDNHRIGDAIYRVMYDAPMLPSICYQLTLVPLIVLVNAVISLYFMAYSYGSVSPELVWAAALMIPIGLCVTLPFSNLSRRVQQDSRAAGTVTTNAIEQNMGSISAVQSLGGMEYEKERIDSQSKESFRRYRHIKIVSIIVQFSTFIAQVAVAFWIAVSITDNIIVGLLTPGDWAVLFGIWMSLAGGAMQIGTFWIALQGDAAAVRRVFAFIDMPTEERENSTVVGNPQVVNVESASFSYPDGRSAFKNVSLSLSRGELIAIVGPTGAGKTTLAYAIAGYVTPTEGQVTYDGINIAEANTDSLRDAVSYVFQEHMLLSESIRSNLLLVNPGATEQQIQKALQTSGAVDVIKSLPLGLDTVVGRSGDTLSVGQKQRLCIARGLIRDTPILILDEPTAALDPATEQVLTGALKEASENKLVLVIAHRLSTIRQADRIVFLEDGEVQEIGSHDELMNQHGSYSRFVQLQAGTSLVE